ncbi:MAG: hypothetical protein AB8C95_05335 [Phycisphaeraceae bacterium]
MKHFLLSPKFCHNATLRGSQALAILILLTLGLSLANAEDPKPTRGEAGDILTPLTMGNTWVYEGDDDDPFITIDRIEGVVIFDGQPWHMLRSYERATDQPDAKDVPLGSELWIAMIDGHECDAFIETDEETSVLKLSDMSKYFRYPATLGDTYQPNADDPTVVITVISLSEKITTKAGEFDCVVYKETSTEDTSYSLTSYIAPGVGIVKNITKEEQETFFSSLRSYTLVEKK